MTGRPCIVGPVRFLVTILVSSYTAYHSLVVDSVCIMCGIVINISWSAHGPYVSLLRNPDQTLLSDILLEEFNNETTYFYSSASCQHQWNKHSSWSLRYYWQGNGGGALTLSPTCQSQSAASMALYFWHRTSSHFDGLKLALYLLWRIQIECCSIISLIEKPTAPVLRRERPWVHISGRRFSWFSYNIVFSPSCESFDG